MKQSARRMAPYLAPVGPIPAVSRSDAIRFHQVTPVGLGSHNTNRLFTIAGLLIDLD